MPLLTCWRTLPFRANMAVLWGNAATHYRTMPKVRTIAYATAMTTTTIPPTSALPTPCALSALAKAVCTRGLSSHHTSSCIIAGNRSDIPADLSKTTVLIASHPLEPVTAVPPSHDDLYFCSHAFGEIGHPYYNSAIWGNNVYRFGAFRTAIMYHIALPAIMFNNLRLPWRNSEYNHLLSTRGFATVSTGGKRKGAGKGERPYRPSKWHIASNKNIVVSQTPKEVFQELEVHCPIFHYFLCKRCGKLKKTRIIF